MKEKYNPKSPNKSKEIIKPISSKKSEDYFESFNNNTQDEANEEIIPENISEKEIEALKNKNKWFFYEYIKLVENNKLLKFKLDELNLKKNEFHKYLSKLENNDKYKNFDYEDNINENNNSISHELINFQSNIYINRKRKRRKKNQIIYKYKCNFKDCNKKYASEGALNQHIKFKHV